MFGLYFGNYLMKKGLINPTQLEEIMLKQQQTRVKLGLIAVSEKLLTTKQAEEINQLQRSMDRRFGDIAIEKGYLLEEEVTHLLNMQGNPFLQFVQVVTESNLLNPDELEQHIDGFKKEYQFSDSDLDSLKSGDIDRIISIFNITDSTLVNNLISLYLRNIVRFISNNIIINKVSKISEYSFGALSSQKMVGDHEFFTGFASQGDELTTIANPFAKENFTVVDEDAFDAVCEFINCTNGLYASKLSLEDVHIDMTPPLFYSNQKLSSKGDLYIVPITINGAQSDLLVAIDNSVEIN